jgi:PAS domain-containing protein
VTGEGPQDRYWRERVLKELTALEGRVEIEAPRGLTLPELLDRLRGLPDGTIVLYVTFTEDAAGSVYSSDALRLVVDASRVPVYVSHAQGVGSGAVGGYVFDYEREAEKAAGVALRVLRGERPEDIGVHEAPGHSFVYDWRQLRRWNLPESRLPAGSEVRFRPASPWDLYRRQILAGLAILALQTVLVVGLLLQARRRRRVEKELAERLRFETLLSDMTRSLARSDIGTLDGEIDKALGRLGAALAVDRAELAEIIEGSSDFTVTFVYVTRPGIEPLPRLLESARFPWLSQRLREGHFVRFSRVSELPEEAAVDRDTLDRLGTQAAVLIPLTMGGAPLGILALAMLREHSWPTELVRRLELSADIFGSALMRRRFERMLEESRGLETSLFTSLHGQAAILERQGTIVAVNQAWTQGGRSEGDGIAPARVGDNYLEELQTAVENGDPDADGVLRGLVAVLGSGTSGFSTEYRTRTVAGERWLEILAEPLRRSAGGAVVTLLDITDRKRAELEAGRLREDLAHLTRVSTLGELAASLAHELNQPLTAILANVQAAQMLMKRPSPDLDEVREILSEVVTDDKRAGEVIRRLGSLFKKGKGERLPLDVNELIGEVLRLLRHDIVLRGASLRTDLGTDLPLVEGDRIQLQQVVLNLAVNGLDAMRDQPAGRRQLTISSGMDRTKMRIEVRTRGAASTRRTGTVSSSPSTRPSPRAWGWAWPSPARSSRPTGEACPWPAMPGPAPDSR